MNAGSTFTVWLPLAQGSGGAVQVAASATVRGARQSLRVLVVDDNVDGAELLATFLELNGHLTQIAHDGQQALAAAVEFQPQIVFLDIGLPDMDGYDVARAIRAKSLEPQPSLIALTGWGTDEHRRLAQIAGMDDHLVKPVDMARVVRVLEAAGERFFGLV